ncbi:MAG: SH3 domain-containing protein [Pseudomonadota bacterium]
MSDFVSNFISYVTATAFCGACLLVGLDTPEDPVLADPPLAARADVVQPLLPSRAATEFPSAVLEEVVFTSAGIDTTPSFKAEDRRPRGTVTGRTVNLRDGPGTGFAIAGRAAQGDALIVTGQQNGIWHEVVDPLQDRRVWIHGNFFTAPAAATTVAQN